MYLSTYLIQAGKDCGEFLFDTNCWTKWHTKRVGGAVNKCGRNSSKF